MELQESFGNLILAARSKIPEDLRMRPLEREIDLLTQEVTDWAETVQRTGDFPPFDLDSAMDLAELLFKADGYAGVAAGITGFLLGWFASKRPTSKLPV